MPRLAGERDLQRQQNYYSYGGARTVSTLAELVERPTHDSRACRISCELTRARSWPVSFHVASSRCHLRYVEGTPARNCDRMRTTQVRAETVAQCLRRAHECYQKESTGIVIPSSTTPRTDGRTVRPHDYDRRTRGAVSHAPGRACSAVVAQCRIGPGADHRRGDMLETDAHESLCIAQLALATHESSRQLVPPSDTGATGGVGVEGDRHRTGPQRARRRTRAYDAALRSVRRTACLLTMRRSSILPARRVERHGTA